ncbi:MAG: hypothetical protein HY744_30705, partial [Deltaproteobacteria bacterium]|nr:hypothetical protein [Deltaproteobacteria bacterium]
LTPGTELVLRFAPAGEPEPFVMRGRVQWVNKVRPSGGNPNPGMGIKFVDLKPAERERLVAVIKTIAYLGSDPEQSN